MVLWLNNFAALALEPRVLGGEFWKKRITLISHDIIIDNVQNYLISLNAICWLNGGSKNQRNSEFDLLESSWILESKPYLIERGPTGLARFVPLLFRRESIF